MPKQTVETNTSPKADRGQLIILTGLIIAVTIVALVLLLNTAIYTENLASRGQDQSAREAIEYRSVTADGIQGLLREENEIRQNVPAIQQGYNPSRDELVRDVRAGIGTLDNFTARQYALGGTIAAIDDVTLHNGTGIHQPENRSMTSNASNRDWQLADDVRGTRDFSMVVKGNLTRTPSPASEAFRITTSNGSNDWSLYVYENDSTGEPEVSVKNGTEPSPNQVGCSIPATLPIAINVAEGSINGTSCSAIQFGKGVSEPYSISYTWGNRSAGTYELTVNSTNIGSVNPIGSADSPFQTPVVYSVDYTVNYETPTLKYRSRVTVEAE